METGAIRSQIRMHYKLYLLILYFLFIGAHGEQVTVCPEITNVDHGSISSTDHGYTDVVSLQCEAGFVLNGYSKVTCEEDGQWSAQLGECITRHGNENYMFLLLLLLIPLLVGGILIYKCRRKLFTCQKPRMVIDDSEVIQHLNVKIQPKAETCHHCEMILKEEFKAANSDAYHMEYLFFQVKVGKEIENVIQSKTNESADVIVTIINQRRKKILFDLKCPAEVSQREIEDALTSSNLSIADATYHVEPGTVKFIDAIRNTLALKIFENKHVRDKKLDRAIDLDTQYVRLKLMTVERMGEVEQFPLPSLGKYQVDMEEQSSTNLGDEDILKPGEITKYVLIRGRAGIGKTTLVQRLLWKWAHGEWATHLKAIFLLNLRILMAIDSKLKLSEILSSCTTYGQLGTSIRNRWLVEHQQHIGIILDGLDEVHKFKELWNETKSLTDLEDEEDPVVWGISLMKRSCLPKVTLIVTSRPFTGLRQLESASPTLIELMGLTPEGVLEFVDKNVTLDRRPAVKKTLEESGILMSVSSISFYCATLCQVLEGDDCIANTLTTYTKITAYITEMFIRRSLKECESSGIVRNVPRDLRALCQLAYSGLVKRGSREVLQLVFGEDDLIQNHVQTDDVTKAEQVGLFLCTEITDPKSSAVKVLGQFVHLSIQEFMAILGLLSQTSDNVKKALDTISTTGEFNMLSLFLYGLAFNMEDDQIQKLCGHLGIQPQVEQEILDMLVEKVMGVPDPLQALQTIHESESAEVAQRVGRQLFPEKVELQNIKLTVVDLLALTFLLEHHQEATSVRLQFVGLDLISVKELARFLRVKNILKKITIIDDGITDEGVKFLAEALTVDRALIELWITSGEVSDEGVELLSASLRVNRTLRDLGLQCSAITDKGLECLREALKVNQTLNRLCLWSNSVTDNGVPSLVKLLTDTPTVQELTFGSIALTDKGLEYLSACLKVNQSLRTLELTSTAITDRGIEQLTASLTENRSLHKLSLYCSSVTDKGAEYIAKTLKTNQTLLTIKLGIRAVTDKGIQLLAGSLEDNRTLETLAFYGYTVKDEGAKAIIKALDANKTVNIMMWTPRCSKDLADQLQKTKRVTIILGAVS